MSTIEEIKYHLKNLGTDRKTVVETLSKQGIQGFRHSSENCPISNYVEKKISDVRAVSCGRESLVLFDEVGRLWPTIWYRKEFPAVAEFIRYFDRGRYPQLDVEENPDFGGI